MNDFNSLINALDSLAGKDNTAPLRWQYAQARAQGRILLPPPHPINSYGEYELGNVWWNGQNAGPFGLYASELPQHIGIFGRTGSGKTNGALLLLQQFLKENKPFLVFDWKETFRPFSSAFSLSHFTPGSSIAPFFNNPFDLDHIPKHSHQGYLRHLLSVLLTVYFRDLKLLSVEGTEYLLLRAIDELSASGKKFTFRDLYYRILSQSTSQREKDWKASVLNLLYKLSTGPIGSVLNAPSSLPIDELAQQQTILELHWLGSPKDKSFLTQLIALQLYYHFSQKPTHSGVRFLLLIEEAHNILLRHDQGYETILEMILRQIREQGVSICLLDQHPSLMSLPALGTYCTIAFNLRAREDISVMGSSLGLADEDSIYLGQLQTGEAIVKLQDRHLKPFLVKFPLAQMPEKAVRDFPLSAGISSKFKGIDSQEGKSDEKAVGDFPVSPGISPKFSGIRGFSGKDKLEPRKENPEEVLLADIAHHPLSKTVQRYSRLGIGSKQGNQVKGKLLKKNMIKPVSINFKRVRIKLYQLTEAGENSLKEKGHKPQQARRHGSLVHLYWMEYIRSRFKKGGYDVRKEHPVGDGKTVDLVVQKGKRPLAIEVETGKSDAAANVRKCLAAGFGSVIVFAVDKKVKRSLVKEGLLQDRRVILILPHELRI
jgi:hypothetical protein